MHVWLFLGGLHAGPPDGRRLAATILGMVTPAFRMGETVDDPEGWSSIRVRQRTRRLFVECAQRLGYTHNDVAELALSYWLDRSVSGFHVESSFLLREMDALERRIEQLVLCNLTLQEVLFGLEGKSLQALIALGQLAAKEMPGTVQPQQTASR